MRSHFVVLLIRSYNTLPLLAPCWYGCPWWSLPFSSHTQNCCPCKPAHPELVVGLSEGFHSKFANPYIILVGRTACMSGKGSSDSREKIGMINNMLVWSNKNLIWYTTIFMTFYDEFHNNLWQRGNQQVDLHISCYTRSEGITLSASVLPFHLCHSFFGGTGRGSCILSFWMTLQVFCFFPPSISSNATH